MDRDMDEAEEIVEEIVDEGDVYEDDMGMNMVDVGEDNMYVDNLHELQPGEYIQLPDGRLIRANEHESGMQHQRHQQATGRQGSYGMQHQQQYRQHPGQQSRQMQQHNENSGPSSYDGQHAVYAVKGNQVYRVERGGVKAVPYMKTHKTEGEMLPPPLPRGGGAKYMTEDPPQAPQQQSQPPNSNTYPPLTYRTGNYQNFRGPVPMPTTAVKQKRIAKKGAGNRKPCNCAKSMCLKLYCECFANGEFCRDCNCKECHNNLEHDDERSRAIRSALDKNPHAFKSKIESGGINRKMHVERLHTKGCHCKKSSCLKNYCECYEARVACTDRCKCCGCKNTQLDRTSAMRDGMGPGALMSLASIAGVQDTPSSLVKDDDTGEDESDEERKQPADPKTMPWYYLTDDVIEATSQCVMTKAAQIEEHNKRIYDTACNGGQASSSEIILDDEMERWLMREFSDKLKSIIDAAKDATAESNAERLRLAEVAATTSKKPKSRALPDVHLHHDSETPLTEVVSTSTVPVDDEKAKQGLPTLVSAEVRPPTKLMYDPLASSVTTTVD